jgi:hypothetical protein
VRGKREVSKIIKLFSTSLMTQNGKILLILIFLTKDKLPILMMMMMPLY